MGRPVFSLWPTKVTTAKPSCEAAPRRPRLCITEDAGTGKSIFTRRLLAFLCGDRARGPARPAGLGGPWEPRVERWPAAFDKSGLIAALADAIEPTVEVTGLRDGPAGRRVVSPAGPHVLILDALDQVTGEPPLCRWKSPFRAAPLRDCRIVLTGRAYAVTDLADVS